MRFNLRQLLIVVGLTALLLGYARYDGREWNYHPVSYLTFSPDGKKLAVLQFRAREEGSLLNSCLADVSRSVALFDTATLSDRLVVQREFRPGIQGPINLWGWEAPIAFTADGKLLLVLDWGGGKICAWDVSSSSWSPGFPLKDSDINAFRLLQVGKMLAVWRRGGMAIWDADSWKRVTPPSVSGGLGTFSPDGKYWAVAERQSVQVWNVQDRKLVRTFRDDRNVHDRVTCLVLSPDGDTVAARGRSGLSLYSLGTGKEQLILPELFKVHDDHGRRITSGLRDSTHGVAFSPDGELLVAWGEYGLKFFDKSHNWRLQRSVTDRLVNCMTFSPNGKTYATGDRNGKVTLWDVATGMEIQSTTF